MAVFDILSQQENQEAILNGIVGIGKGEHDIPGSIVSVDTAPNKREAVVVGHFTEQPINQNSNMNGNVLRGDPVSVGTIGAAATVVQQGPMVKQMFNPSRIPHVIWVIGGPGSNKATLCLKAVGLNPGWGHIR